MAISLAGITAGLIGGSVMSGIMVIGRRAGFLHPTLNEHAENWLDRTLRSRDRIGSRGTMILEQMSHLAASGVFGIGYANARRYSGALPPVLLGVLFGSALYVANIVVAAPLIGITRGEHNERLSVALQRLATHLIFGIVTAAAAERLIDKHAAQQSDHQLA